MKKVLWIAALVLALSGMVGQSWAAMSDSITVTVSLIEEVAVSLDNNTWAIGSIALSGTDALATVTATNDGNVTIDLEIKGADGAGGWTIGAAPGADTFEVELTAPAISLTASDQNLVSSLATSGTKTIDLTYNAPTSDTIGGGVDQGFAITVTASKTP